MIDSPFRLKETREPSAVRRELAIEVTAPYVAHELEHVISEVARNARIDGFRRGKVPRSLLRKRFAREIDDELLEHVVPKALRQLLPETGLVPIHQPVITEISLKDGEPLSFTAAFEIRPKVVPKNYKGVAIRKHEGEVNDDMVLAQLDQLRESAVQYEPEAPRPLVAGDFVLSDIRSTTDGESETHDGALLEVGGANYHPEFARNLMGRKPGETVEFAVTYGDDDPDPRARGKTVAYALSLKEVKRKVLPDLDDDFAQDLGEFTTLQELKADLRRKLEARMVQEALAAQEREIAETLVPAVEVEVPNAMVEMELDRALQEQARSLMMRGIDPETAPIDWRQTRQRMRDGAIRNVKWHLLLDAIAAEEKIEPTAEELEERLREIAADSKKSVEFVRSKIEKDGRMEELRAGLRKRHTVDFLLRNAKMERR